MPLLKNVRVIIRQLFARFHITDRLDPDSSPLDDRIAVGIARVVDEPRIVAIHCRVDDDVVVYCKEIRVVPLPLVVRIPLVGLPRRQSLARVLDKPGSSFDRLRRKGAEALDGRFGDPEWLHRDQAMGRNLSRIPQSSDATRASPSFSMAYPAVAILAAAH